MPGRKEKQKAGKEGIQEGREKGIREGIHEGIHEGIIQTAQKMKQNGMTNELIANVTGLSIAEIEQL